MSTQTLSSRGEMAAGGVIGVDDYAYSGPGHLPSGRHGLAPEFVHAHQRERLLLGVSEACATRGYATATIADIVRAAGVSRRTFYNHFASKEECFLAAYQMLLSHMEKVVADACALAGRHWPDRFAAALQDFLAELACRPAFAKTLFVDALSAGPRAIACRQQALSRHIHLIPVPAQAPPELGESVAGGVIETIYHTVRAGQTKELPGMYDELLYCLLVPLLGHEETTEVCGRVKALTNSSS